MPRLKATQIDLSESEHQELAQLLRRTSTPQQVALRAKIILRAAEGSSNGKIAKELGMSIEMSRLWRRRWRELSAREVAVGERLKDAPRPGSPGNFTMEQITQLYAIACSPPEQYGRPLSHWSARELALEMVEQSVVESISERHVGRLLKEADLKPHQSNYWLNPPPTINSHRKSKISARSMS
jgi:putative transposase